MGSSSSCVEREVASVDELHAALRALQPSEIDAIFYGGDGMVSSQAPALIETGMTSGYRPCSTIMQRRMGALASYGVSYRMIGQQSAKHVQRILLGARRVIFLSSGSTGSTCDQSEDRQGDRGDGPQSVVARADEVIQ